jgi:hypothetical protein
MRRAFRMALEWARENKVVEHCEQAGALSTNLVGDGRRGPHGQQILPIRRRDRGRRGRNATC